MLHAELCLININGACSHGYHGTDDHHDFKVCTFVGIYPFIYYPSLAFRYKYYLILPGNYYPVLKYRF